MFALSKEELTHYKECWLSFLDPDRPGDWLSGAQLSDWFSSSGLTPEQLAQVWDTCDPDDTGILDWNQFVSALRLIAHTQSNQVFNEMLMYEQPPNLPRLNPPIKFIVPKEENKNNANNSNNDVTKRSVDSWLPIPSDDEKEYEKLFYESDKSNDGYISGSVAREIMLRSGLSTESLYQIWEMIDTEKRGKLNLQQFKVIGHLVATVLTSGCEVPKELPKELKQYINYDLSVHPNNDDLLKLSNEEFLVSPKPVSNVLLNESLLLNTEDKPFLYRPSPTKQDLKDVVKVKEKGEDNYIEEDDMLRQLRVRKNENEND